MRSMMVQRQVPDMAEPFRRVLVCGSAAEALSLLEQAYPAIGGREGAVRLLETAASSEANALDRLLASLHRREIATARERAATLDEKTVVDTVRRDADQLVLKAIARASGTRTAGERGMALDALDRALIDRCPCALWLGDVASRRPPRRIVAALDPGPGPEDLLGQALSQEVLTTAGAVAALSDAELHLVHASVPFGAHFLRSRTEPAEYAAYVRDARDAAEAALLDLVTSAPPPVPVPPSRIHVVTGEPYLQLPRFVAARQIDLVVIGTRGRRSRVSSALAAPHARQVLERAHCSALIVKLPG